MSLFDEAVKKSQTIGTYQPHPFGEFAGMVTQVKAGEANGKKLFEIHLKSSEGTCKHTVWETRESDITGRLLAINKGDVEKAKGTYRDTIARAIFLYRAMDLPLPTSENAVYQGLGQLAGRACHFEVRENKKDVKNPYVNVVMPPEDAHAPPMHDRAGNFTPAAAAGGYPASTGNFGGPSGGSFTADPSQLADLPF